MNNNYVKRRRRKRIVKKLLALAVVLIIIAITAGCIRHVDKMCALGLDLLPEEAYMTLDVSEPIVAEPEPEPVYPIYDIPLPEELQQFTYERCLAYDVDPVMVYAIIEIESGYKEDLISKTNDYGLMQISDGNHGYLKDTLGTTDFLDPVQNIDAGIFWLAGIQSNYSDPNKILMVYQMGGRVAEEIMAAGTENTSYSRRVLKSMKEIQERQMR